VKKKSKGKSLGGGSVEKENGGLALRVWGEPEEMLNRTERNVTRGASSKRMVWAKKFRRFFARSGEKGAEILSNRLIEVKKRDKKNRTEGVGGGISALGDPAGIKVG